MENSMEALMCPWEAPQYLIFSSNVPTLLYYSHIPALIISLLLGVYVFTKRKNNLSAKILLFIVLAFSLYNILDLLIWATNRSDFVMFWWSLQILLEVIVYAGSLYLSYVFIRGKDMPFKLKLIVFSLLLPLIVLTPTKYNLIGIDLSWCDAIENFVALYYSYFLEFIFLMWGVLLAFIGIRRAKQKEERQRIRYFALGIIIFLLALISGNLIGSFTGDWDLAQFGFFGMPIFIGFLTYIIVRYKVFNLRIFGTQVLVVGLWFLLAALFFVQSVEVIRIVLVATLAIAVVMGIFLIRGVQKEIRQREQLETVTDELERANKKLKSLDQLKTEFLSLASHQLRSPLTAIKGYASMLVEEEFGRVTKKQREPLERIYISSNHLAKVIEDLLNVSKIEQGGMKYEFTQVNLYELIAEIVDELAIAADKKGLSFDIDKPDDIEQFDVSVDVDKFRQVLLNLIDNAIKYTEEGSVTLRLLRKKKIIQLQVEDTGMGLSRETKEKLFEKFSRGKGGRVNTSGSGLGLYLAREIVKAHKGKIWVESPGEGKGSTFFVELRAAPKR